MAPCSSILSWKTTGRRAGRLPSATVARVDLARLLSTHRSARFSRCWWPQAAPKLTASQATPPGLCRTCVPEPGVWALFRSLSNSGLFSTGACASVPQRDSPTPRAPPQPLVLRPHPGWSCIPNHCREAENLSVSERLPGFYLSSLGKCLLRSLANVSGYLGGFCYSAPSLAHLLTTPSGTESPFASIFLPSAACFAQCHNSVFGKSGELSILMRSSASVYSSVDGALG